MTMLGFSMAACCDHSGHRVFDAHLFVFDADGGGIAPAYADSTLGTRHPTPVPLRSGGIWPQIYLAPGTYNLRVTDPTNFIYDEIDGLRIDPPNTDSGGSSGVDERRLSQTGDIKDRYGIGSHPGWARCNGRSIGSAASSATERANADCEALFVFLWTQDPNLAVSGGRGANAASDWAAGKTIALPDMRGRARLAVDDLGTTSAGRLTGGKFAFGAPTTLGSYGGEASHVQTVNEMASHNHTATATMAAAGAHTHTGTTAAAGSHFHEVPYRQEVGYGFDPREASFPGVTSVGAAGASPNFIGYTGAAAAHTHTYTTGSAGSHAHALTVSVASRGSSVAMNWLPPFILASTFIRL